MDSFAADGIFIDATPERVFAALLDPEDIRVWMNAEEAAVEARIGGRFSARRADGSSVAGSIAALEPGARLVIGDYRWERAGERRGPMTLGFTLERRGPGIWITIRQDGLDAGKNWHPFALDTRKELVRATVALKRHIEQI